MFAIMTTAFTGLVYEYDIICWCMLCGWNCSFDSVL